MDNSHAKVLKLSLQTGSGNGKFATYVGVTHVGVLIATQSTPQDLLQVKEKYRLVL